jgi:hypothetical protein
MRVQKRKYSCAACGAGVQKYSPCHAEKDKDGNKTDYAGLGGWRCTGNCKGKIKIKVELVKQ